MTAQFPGPYILASLLDASILINTDIAAGDEHWMRLAIAAAERALAGGEVPIGACVVAGNGRILASSGNRTRSDCDPTAHAEILALRQAAKTIGNYRLIDAVVYSTIEPCAMCAGALIQARIKRLVYGARDERAGAIESEFRICDSNALNHKVEVTAGVLEAQCRELMQNFFQMRRTAIKMRCKPISGQ